MTGSVMNNKGRVFDHSRLTISLFTSQRAIDPYDPRKEEIYQELYRLTRSAKNLIEYEEIVDRYMREHQLGIYDPTFNQDP